MMLSRVFPALVVVLILLPVATALPTSLRFGSVETGEIHGRSHLEAPGAKWIRDYALDVSYVFEGDYNAYQDAGIWTGVGETRLQVNGTLHVTLDDGGSQGVLHCTLEGNSTAPTGMRALERGADLLLTMGSGLVGDKQWKCEQTQIVHASPEDIVVAPLALEHGVGPYEAGAFPRETALALMLVQENGRWPDSADPDRQMRDIVDGRYMRAQPKLGMQEISIEKKYVDASTARGLACPDMQDEELFGTNGTWSCDVKAHHALKISDYVDAVSGDDGGATSSGEMRGGAGDASGSGNAKQTPGAMLGIVLGVVVLAALARRRR